MDYEKLQKDLENRLHQVIPATRLLGFKVLDLTENKLSIFAPLERNINDKKTGFGGSIVSLCTTTGWSLCYLLELIYGFSNDIVIHTSSIVYKRPIKEDFVASVNFPPKTKIEEILATLQQQEKASLDLEISITENDKECVAFKGKYVFI